jgi:hypothetical protein
MTLALAQASLRRNPPNVRRDPMTASLLAAAPLLARLYAVLAYACSLLLLFSAAVLTGTRARDAFILAFLPGVLMAVLSVFIWSGRRAAMILALAVSVVVELMMVGHDPGNWWQLLAVPVVFTLLTAMGLRAGPARAADGAAERAADEVYAAVVYFAGLLAVFMAPFNHSRHFGATGVALYALLVGFVAAGLSVFIRAGKVWAMVATFVLALAHWVALASLDPTLWRSLPFIAAPVVCGVLVVVCIAVDRGKAA